MSRRAILIANSASYSDITKNVPRSTINSVLDELGANLSGLDGERRSDDIRIPSAEILCASPSSFRISSQGHVSLSGSLCLKKDCIV